jgi:hypothetical protein
MVISSSLCENTGGFACSLYRTTHSLPSGNQSGSAKFTASLKLIYSRRHQLQPLVHTDPPRPMLPLTPWLKPQ